MENDIGGEPDSLVDSADDAWSVTCDQEKSQVDEPKMSPKMSPKKAKVHDANRKQHVSAARKRKESSPKRDVVANKRQKPETDSSSDITRDSNSNSTSSTKLDSENPTSNPPDIKKAKTGPYKCFPDPLLTIMPATKKKGFLNGKIFLLTGASVPNIDIPFCTDELTTRITEADGIVYRYFSEEKWKYLSSVKQQNHFVIAPHYSDTEIYLRAVVSGLLCVHHAWILYCHQQNKCLRFKPYLLPTGLNSTNNSVITREPNQQMFKNLFCVIVSTNNSSAYKVWEVILKLGGANVLPANYASRNDLYSTQTHGRVPVAIIISKTTKEEENRLIVNRFKLASLDWIKNWIALGRRPTLKKSSLR